MQEIIQGTPNKLPNMIMNVLSQVILPKVVDKAIDTMNKTANELPNKSSIQNVQPDQVSKVEPKITVNLNFFINDPEHKIDPSTYVPIKFIN